jgi:hypothetical protein
VNTTRTLSQYGLIVSPISVDAQSFHDGEPSPTMRSHRANATTELPAVHGLRSLLA